MVKSNKSKDSYGADKTRILEILHKRPYNLAELDQIGIRQNIRRSIRRLLQDREIRAFIKIKKLSKVKPVGILAEEIFFSIAPGDYPQEIHELKKLIKDMCEDNPENASAYEDFINKCIEREIQRDDAIKIAYDLITGLHPDLKAKIIFELASYKDPSFTIDSYNPETKELEFTIKPGWDTHKIVNYDYLIKK